MKERKEIIFLLTTVINLFNFIDRGIIPGSPNEFNSFIQNSLQTKTPDVYLGLLQSSFVIGFLLGALLFGHLIHYYERFSLTRIGSWIWWIAVFFSGIAYYLQNYYFLLICRMISGFGEASLQCTIPPWITKHADQNKRGIWLSVFYTAIPVGTALGYAYSSLVTSMLPWSWAFFGECIFVLPFLGYLFRLSDEEDLVHSSSAETRIELMETSSYSPLTNVALGEQDEPEDNSDALQIKDVNRDVSNPSQDKPTFFKELKTICQEPIYVCFIFGAAAQTAVLIGLSTFGSSFVMGLGYFNVESEASSMFGLLISISGVVATPLGGWFVDSIASRNHTTSSTEVKASLDKFQLLNIIGGISYWFNFLGTLLFCCLYYVNDRVSYLFCITIACACIFVTNTGVNLAIMIAVPIQHQSFAIAFGSLTGHLLGDVPSPVFAGWLKDALAPDCIGNESSSDNNVAASSACRKDASGLRMCIFIISIWLYWAVFFFGSAWYLVRRRLEKIC